jgi:hypothetical protein
MADAPSNSTQKSGVGSGIRISIAIFISIAMGIFMLLWDGGYIGGLGIPQWVGSFIFSPFLAVLLGLGGNSAIQQLSCGKVQWLIQLQRIAIVPVPFILLWILIYFVPGMRWPIEGLIQDQTPQMKKGISSGFYTFWMSMYVQSIMTGLSQIC